MSPALKQPVGSLHVHRVILEMKRSIDWYVTTLGFFYDHGVRDTAWLTAPGVLLTLSPGSPEPDPQSYFGFALGSPEELDSVYQRLHSRFERLSSPADVHTGRPFFFTYDPDDYPIIFSYSKLDYPEKWKD